jgi:hypothetical protein
MRRVECVYVCVIHSCETLPSRLDTNLFYNKSDGCTGKMAAGGSNEKCYTETGGTWCNLDAWLATG